MDAVRVDPVSVENAVRDRPGTLMEDAFNVETVSVEFTVAKFAFKLETTTVEAVRVDPVSVENAVRDRPGTLMVDAFNVDTVIVELTVRALVCMVEEYV